MPVERKRPDQIAAESEREGRRFIESDFKIRSGLCPNGCGLMTFADGIQACATCSFVCNIPPELEKQ